MTVKTTVYVCQEKGLDAVPQEVELPIMGEDEVHLEMICSGLCHTDCHMLTNDWGVTRYPCVAGHEGVGRVVAAGSKVTELKVGDKAGVGWIRDSCRSCQPCISGDENICHKGYSGTFLGDNHMGGCFAKDMVINQRFAFKIPDSLSPYDVAPLFCAGITVYQPLRKFVRENSKVGIISMGGLGHMAVQFAAAMNLEVTAFSTSPSKEVECRKLGVRHFVNSKDKDQIAKHINSLDVIVNTCPYAVDYNQYISCLRPDGVFCQCGIPDQGCSHADLEMYPIVLGQRSFSGSIVGGSRLTKDMLEFAVKHKVSPLIEKMPFKDINKAFERLLKGDLQAYRIVLVHEGKENEK